MTDDQNTPWTRERHSFSCTQETWDAAKKAWMSDLNTYPAWTEWLEAALAEAIATTRQQYGELATAPARIPPGRRESAPTDAPSRTRRAFTCQPHIWADTRNAWWTERDSATHLSDWISTAMSTKAAATPDRDPTTQRTPR
ncbi:hypothetical protein [Williamsia sp. 1135]|uniref:hypothetical protein n=1 Tax=Williamsia sp. 1135 TaxID=1889262 RepID=UPI000A11F40C|nr:hypothetical protein [Williamsia sp. 1135]ORM35492.1 hypothetical protein BFL43_09230 [Williamsia sp. 1135]